MYMYLRNDFEGHSFFPCKTKFVAKPEFQNWRAFRLVYVVVLRHCACIFSAMCHEIGTNLLLFTWCNARAARARAAQLVALRHHAGI